MGLTSRIIIFCFYVLILQSTQASVSYDYKVSYAANDSLLAAQKNAQGTASSDVGIKISDAGANIENNTIPAGGIGGTGNSPTRTGGIGGTGNSTPTGGIGGTGQVPTLPEFTNIPNIPDIPAPVDFIPDIPGSISDIPGSMPTIAPMPPSTVSGGVIPNVVIPE